MKKNFNAFIAALAVCTMPLNSLAGINTVYAAQNENKVIKGSFTFGAHDSDVDLTDNYEYSDSYFDKSGYEDNINLAVMSMQMAAASISSNDVNYAEKSRNVQNLLSQIGFNEISVNDYYKQKMDFNTMGVAAAYKVIGDSVVLALVPRSAGYENEWAGNFVVGDDGKYHKGFDITSDIVLDFAKDYVAAHNDVFNGRTVKIWTMGYSRGAATANLVGAKLIDNPECLGVTVTPDNIYDYTFGTPETTTDSNAKNDIYNCIKSYMSDYDIVTMVPFKSWGFTRYGKENALDVHNEAIKEKFYDCLLTLNKNVYDIYAATDSTENPDNFKAKTLGENLTIIDDNTTTITQKSFLEDRINYITNKYAASREVYNDKYEEALSVMIGLYLGADEDAVSAFGEGITNSADKYKALITLFFADYIETYCNKMGLDNKLSVITENDIDILPDPSVTTDNEVVDNFLNSDDYKKFYSMAADSVKNGYLNGNRTYADLLSEYNTYRNESVKAVINDGLTALKDAGYTDEYNKYHTIAEDNNPEALADIISGAAFGINYTDDMTMGDILVKKINQICTFAGNSGYMRVHNNEIILSWLRAMNTEPVIDDTTESDNNGAYEDAALNNGDSPATADNNHILLYICLILSATITVISVTDKKRKNNIDSDR